MKPFSMHIKVLLLILAIPLIAWYFDLEFLGLTRPEGWYAELDNHLNNITVFIFFIFTETVSFPYGIVTAFLFGILFSYLFKLSLKQTVILFIIIGLCLIFGLAIKSLLKHITSEPRPYMIWLANLAEPVRLDLALYYALDDKDAKEKLLSNIIHQPLFEQWNIPNWLAKHWVSDKEYSFPSGHTFFACFFALLASLLFNKSDKFIVFSLTLWACIVMLSRLFLGMHRPVDLIGGIIIAMATSMLCYYLIKKFVNIPKIS